MSTDTKTPHLVQLATRIPIDLHRKMKLHCVKEGNTVADFVTNAIEKALKASK